MARYWQILTRVISAIVGAGLGLTALSLVVKSTNLDLLGASTWFLGTVLVISTVVTSLMWWRRACDTDPASQHRTSVLLYSYLYGFLACSISILALMAYLFFQRGEILGGSICVFLACIALMAHWSITASLLQLTQENRGRF